MNIDELDQKRKEFIANLLETTIKNIDERIILQSEFGAAKVKIDISNYKNFHLISDELINYYNNNGFVAKKEVVNIEQRRSYGFDCFSKHYLNIDWSIKNTLV